jgi:DNA-binding PadR family transcriptional regulator
MMPSHHFGCWPRRTAGAPRGLLRILVLRLLKEKPMSGAEIAEEIERETGGRWKPSPGSIYPLLAWLQDKDYTKELPIEEGGMKRYVPTEKGKQFFEEQAKFGQRLMKKLEFLAPMLVGGFPLKLKSENLHEIRQPARRFVTAFFDLRAALKKNLTEQTLREVADILNESAEKLEEITKRLKKR